MKQRHKRQRYRTRYFHDKSDSRMFPKSCRNGVVILKTGETGHDDHNCWCWYLIARYK